MDRAVRLDAVFGVVSLAVGVVDLQCGVFEFVFAEKNGLDIGAHCISPLRRSPEYARIATAGPM
jgi:hypothetical protein